MFNALLSFSPQMLHIMYIITIHGKLNNMTEDEMISTLASDGMLVKRPILVGEDIILIGFKEKEWNEYFSKKEGGII